ncbi:MAG TPA: efflux RND transporter periplasmic adaptor subunit [Devosiaceae bacterium]|jgi:RND family efflux transporter MFP subunit|nr:efflux RND transporter periplasmic adaptor subunit [Devosiaceae bacterium]
MSITGPRQRGVVVVAVLALTLSVAGCSPQPKAAERPPRTVSVLLAKAQDIPLTATLSGEIAAQVQHDLSFRAGGQVADLLVDVGDHVRKDQVLAHLDPHELQANADLAAASVSSAQAQVTQAQANFDRQNALFGQGNTTRADLDSAQTALDTAKSALAGAQAQAASAKDTLGYAELRANADGIVVARAVEVGQVVQAAQPVYTVAEDGPRDAVFQTYEQGLVGVPRDVTVKIVLLSDPSVVATGHVREISPTINTSTGTVRVKVGLDPGSPEMALGASVTGSVPLPPGHGYALPWSALFRNETGPALWVVDPGTDKVFLKPVVVDRYLDASVIVGSGIADGEMIVATGLQLLRPGEKVKPASGSTP